MSADYIAELADVIRKLHGSEASYVETVPVKETFQDQVVWEGEVEVFDLIDNPQASRVYAWSHETNRADEPKRTVTVLHIAPVTSPELAVRASIIQDYREGIDYGKH
ncbi:MAG TPA: hypothetical protein VJU84_02755 [Pyrinomonadaceae bacterium]|nr:hypothetical protein [Pyrinomonadaceae bacterium]